MVDCSLDERAGDAVLGEKLRRLLGVTDFFIHRFRDDSGEAVFAFVALRSQRLDDPADFTDRIANVAGVLARELDDFDRVLGVLSLRRREDAAPPVPADEIERLIEERREARKARNFARADEIRRDLDARGILLEDSPTGTRWKLKAGTR